VDHGVVLTSHFRGPPRDPVRLALSLAGHTDEAQQLAHHTVDVVVDDHQVGQFGTESFLIVGLTETLDHMMVRVSTALKTTALFVTRRRLNENEQSLGMPNLYLLRSVKLNFQDDVMAVFRCRHR
jgi:hypothetical protein